MAKQPSESQKKTHQRLHTVTHLALTQVNQPIPNAPISPNNSHNIRNPLGLLLLHLGRIELLIHRVQPSQHVLFLGLSYGHGIEPYRMWGMLGRLLLVDHGDGKVDLRGLEGVEGVSLLVVVAILEFGGAREVGSQFLELVHGWRLRCRR